MGLIGTYTDGKEMERSLKYERDRRESIAALEATIAKAEHGEKITAAEAKRARAALSWFVDPFGRM